MKKKPRIPKAVIEARQATKARGAGLPAASTANPFSELAVARQLDLDTLARIA
ncbi:hypothetical protein [Pseudomonas sp. NPDC007930]|uniref:hypothetical protein n=1 Tax=Pseudomonas sp. NPDC007930 TaxID=3364417 RepID=UPI0036E0CF17